MKIFTSIGEMQKEANRLRRGGVRLGCVPTMGFLHEGHLSLIRTARRHCDTVIVTLFVNPTQFAPHEDFSQYPRDMARDIDLLKQEGADYLFAPEADAMYPEGNTSTVAVGGITQVLEGASRPTHFQGVTTVVAKLMNITKPDVMVLGQKDAQQVAVLRSMARDLNFDTRILVSPIVREPGGLALSSRNTYLSDEDRAEALALYRSLQTAKQLYDSGVRDPGTIQHAVEAEITRSGAVSLDYAAVVDAETLSKPDRLPDDKQTLVAVAARVGKVRLIDNILLGSEAN